MAIKKNDPVCSVSKALLKANNIGFAAIVVEEAEGTITLKGVVESERDRTSVEALTRKQRGVIDVINELKVSIY